MRDDSTWIQTYTGRQVWQDYIIYDIDMSEIQHDDEFNCRGKIAPFDVIKWYEVPKEIMETL